MVGVKSFASSSKVPRPGDGCKEREVQTEIDPKQHQFWKLGPADVAGLRKG